MYKKSEALFARRKGSRDKSKRKRRALMIGAGIAGAGVLAAGGIGAAKLLKKGKNVAKGGANVAENAKTATKKGDDFIPKSDRRPQPYRQQGIRTEYAGTGEQIRRREDLSEAINRKNSGANQTRRKKGLLGLPEGEEYIRPEKYKSPAKVAEKKAKNKALIEKRKQRLQRDIQRYNENVKDFYDRKKRKDSLAKDVGRTGSRGMKAQSAQRSFEDKQGIMRSLVGRMRVKANETKLKAYMKLAKFYRFSRKYDRFYFS